MSAETLNTLGVYVAYFLLFGSCLFSAVCSVYFSILVFIKIQKLGEKRRSVARKTKRFKRNDKKQKWIAEGESKLPALFEAERDGEGKLVADFTVLPSGRVRVWQLVDVLQSLDSDSFVYFDDPVNKVTYHILSVDSTDSGKFVYLNGVSEPSFLREEYDLEKV